MNLRYMLDGEWNELEVEGPTMAGADEVLLDRDDDLTGAAPWSGRGYTVAPFLDAPARLALRDGVTTMMESFLRNEPTLVGGGFSLERYHEFVDDAAHARVIARIRSGFPLGELPIACGVIERQIAEIVGSAVTARNPHTGDGVFNVRVIRPGRSDNNPPHRDVWLDRLRGAINLYAPVAGSDARSSLPLVPESHRWRESEIERTCVGARVAGLEYTVPAVTGSARPLVFLRPDPRPDEALVFSPYLIHGGAINRNHDRTRCSIEMRFWRQKDAHCARV